MIDVLHMPCGCPYPKIGDHRPCEHGNNAYDDGVPSQPDRDTAYAAWRDSTRADLRIFPSIEGVAREAHAAGWDAATQAERQRIHDKLTTIVTRWAADTNSAPVPSDSLLGRLLYAIRTLDDQ